MSEGTLVVRRYLADTPDPSVDAVVLMSPLVQASRVYLPPKSTSGWGTGTSWLLRGMLAAAGFTEGPPISPDEPFARSLLDDAVLYRNQMLCPVPGIRMVAFVPLADATVVPPHRYAHIPVVGLLDVHGGMLPRADVQRELLAFLTGGPARGHSGPALPIVQEAASGWRPRPWPCRSIPHGTPPVCRTRPSLRTAVRSGSPGRTVRRYRPRA